MAFILLIDFVDEGGCHKQLSLLISCHYYVIHLFYELINLKILNLLKYRFLSSWQNFLWKVAFLNVLFWNMPFEPSGCLNALNTVIGVSSVFNCYRICLFGSLTTFCLGSLDNYGSKQLPFILVFTCSMQSVDNGLNLGIVSKCSTLGSPLTFKHSCIEFNCHWKRSLFTPYCI